MQATHYRGSIDGDIKAYLKEMHENGVVCPSFTGYEPFKQVWDLGVIHPEITSIRLKFISRDEHYMVVDEHQVQGVELKMHSGQDGLFDTKELLTKTQAPFWEIDGLDPKAYRG